MTGPTTSALPMALDRSNRQPGSPVVFLHIPKAAPRTPPHVRARIRTRTLPVVRTLAPPRRTSTRCAAEALKP